MHLQLISNFKHIQYVPRQERKSWVIYSTRMRRRSSSGSLDDAWFQCCVGERLIGQETHYVSLGSETARRGRGESLYQILTSLKRSDLIRPNMSRQ
jgi:hypothetical protein